MPTPPEYCDATDLLVPANAISMIGAGVVTKQIQRASVEANSFLAARYTLPLVSWSSDLRGSVADIVTLRLLRLRGMNVEDPANALIVKAHDDAFKMLREVASGTRTLDVVATDPLPDLLPDVATDSPRDLQSDDPSGADIFNPFDGF